MEMKSIVNTTNGFIVLSDSFASAVFKKSFLKLFQKDEEGNMKIHFNATVEVNMTRELKVCGLIGSAISAKKKASCVGDTVIV